MNSLVAQQRNEHLYRLKIIKSDSLYPLDYILKISLPSSKVLTDKSFYCFSIILLKSIAAQSACILY